MTTEQFDLGTVLTVTTGRLLTVLSSTEGDNGIGDLYRLIDHMRGFPHWTHMLPKGAEACKPVLFERYPALANVSVSRLDELIAEKGEGGCLAFLHELIEAGLPAKFDIEPIGGVVVPEHPVASLVAMVGAEKVVVVETE